MYLNYSSVFDSNEDRLHGLEKKILASFQIFRSSQTTVNYNFSFLSIDFSVFFWFSILFPCSGKYFRRYYRVETEFECSSHVVFKESCFAYVLHRVFRLLVSLHALTPEYSSPTRFFARERHVAAAGLLSPRRAKRKLKSDFPLTRNLCLITLCHGITKAISPVWIKNWQKKGQRCKRNFCTYCTIWHWNLE